MVSETALPMQKDAAIQQDSGVPAAAVAAPTRIKRKRWYIVNVYTGSENVARASLLERVKTEGLDELFGDI